MRIDNNQFHVFPNDIIDRITAFVKTRRGSILDSTDYTHFLTHIFRLFAMEHVEPKPTDPRILEVSKIGRPR